uniref:Uncharacterized protein n=1 Tax=Rhizophora mucronata TaxID=61149 RepID=A0A2P2R2H6_RHIMU
MSITHKLVSHFLYIYSPDFQSVNFYKEFTVT